MEFKKELHEGTEYHFPATFKNVEEFLKSTPQPVISSEAAKVMKWDEIRNTRARLISTTDWTQTADSPLSAEKKAEFAAYRQALRDLPQSTDNPDDIVWPVKPE